MGLLADLLVYVSYGVLFVFAVVCLACGLYYMAELVEEYTTLTKKVLRVAIASVLAAHAVWYVAEALPTACVLAGVVAHASYWLLLRSFPFIELGSVNFIGSALLLVANHALWFRHFTLAYYPFPEIVAYFLLFVWLVPFVFFISLSANEHALPLRAGRLAAAHNTDDDDHAARSKSSSLLKSFIARFKGAAQYVAGGSSKSL